MFQDTQPAALGDESLARFRVDQRAEVGALLRQLCDNGTPVVLSAPQGAALVSTLWSLDSHSGRLHFAAPGHDPQLAALVSADEAVAVAYLDAVKLQFDLQDLMLVRGREKVALQTAWPDAVYRFQRRASYRVRTLERHAPHARLRHPALPEMTLTLRVLDISIGGCALLLPDDVPGLEPGTLLHGVQVELDTDTRFGAALRIQHVSSQPPPASGQKLGCEWVSLGGDATRSLQRCIDRTQKRRRMLSLDL